MDGRASWRRPDRHISSLRMRGGAFVSVFIIALVSAASQSVLSASASLEIDDIRTVIEQVDTSNMMKTIDDLQGYGSRSFVLETSKDAAQYIYNRFVELELETEMQEFQVEDVVCYNVIATLRTHSVNEEIYLFGAHYDSENKLADNLTETQDIPAPGADDDASGVAVVIEMANILSKMRLKNTVKFVAFGAEEYGYDHSGGCAGSQFFVEQELAYGNEYADSAIFDMVGYRSAIQNMTTIIENYESTLATAAVDVAQQLGLDLSIDLVFDPTAIYSDHSSFWAAGYSSILVTEEVRESTIIPINPYYHTSEDIVDYLSDEQIGAICQLVLGGIVFLSGEQVGGDSLMLGIAIIMIAAIAVTIFIAISMKRRK